MPGVGARLPPLTLRQGAITAKATLRIARILVYPLFVILLMLEIVHRVPLPLKQVFIVLFTAVLLAATIAPITDAVQQRFRIPRRATVLFV